MGKHYLQFVYGFWSTIYDSVLDRVFAFDREAAIKLLNPRKNQKILEVGCGTGLSLPLYPAGCDVTAVDFSASMLDKAKRKDTRAKVTFILADGEELPLKKNRFDKVYLSFVLRVTPNPGLLLQQVAQALKPGGKLVVVDHFCFPIPVLDSLIAFLGWGHDRTLHEYLKGTKWKVIKGVQVGRTQDTKAYLLENKHPKGF